LLDMPSTICFINQHNHSLKKTELTIFILPTA